MGAVTAGHVPVRLDAPSLLGPPSGRREGYTLSSLALAVELAERVDWRTNTTEGFCSVASARAQGMTWRRLKVGLAMLAEAGVGGAALELFRPGRAWVTPREEPTSLLHDRSRSDERFVPLARGALDGLAEEHGLSWVARSLLVALLLLCDHRDATLPEGRWTKTRLCERFGIGWHRLSAGLEALAQAGLVSYEVRRGGPMHLVLLAREALVAPVAPRPPRRRERRALQRAAEHGDGVARQVAEALLRHHHLEATPSPTLVRSLGDVLARGISPAALLERLAARGSLAGAADPLAVLVTRVRQCRDDLLAAEQAARRRREAEAERERALAAARDEEGEHEARWLDEDRWLAGVLPRLPEPESLGLPPLVASQARLVAAHLHTALAGVIEAWPELDPEGLVERWAERPCPASELDVTGIGERQPDLHGPPGAVPRSREGPRLLERLTPTP